MTICDICDRTFLGGIGVTIITEGCEYCRPGQVCESYAKTEPGQYGHPEPVDHGDEDDRDQT